MRDNPTQSSLIWVSNPAAGACLSAGTNLATAAPGGRRTGIVIMSKLPQPVQRLLRRFVDVGRSQLMPSSTAQSNETLTLRRFCPGGYGRRHPQQPLASPPLHEQVGLPVRFRNPKIGKELTNLNLSRCYVCVATSEEIPTCIPKRPVDQASGSSLSARLVEEEG